MITFLGYEKSLTNLAATAIADRLTLADVESTDTAVIVQEVLGKLGIADSEVAVADTAGLKRVEVQHRAFELFSLQGVSFGVNEG
jgi:hypothetical protein